MSIKKRFNWGFVIPVTILSAALLYLLYPYLLYQVMGWQKAFHQQISASLTHLAAQQQAGIMLALISFLYGIFHAVGPGHGKFILTGYLSLERTKLKQAVKISLYSAILQGIVAVLLVSIIIGVFAFSRSYFNLTVQWFERASFLFMLFLGCYWLWQTQKQRGKIKIRRLSPLQKVQKFQPLAKQPTKATQCSCGHQHLPTSAQMEEAKPQWLLILSIGIRPCSGAILVLFLSHTLNLFAWGILSALVMALGTGITLNLFACIVLFARQRAIKLSQGYFPEKWSRFLAVGLKGLVGVALIVLAILLLHSSFIDMPATHIFKKI